MTINITKHEINPLGGRWDRDRWRIDLEFESDDDDKSRVYGTASFETESFGSVAWKKVPELASMSYADGAIPKPIVRRELMEELRRSMPALTPALRKKVAGEMRVLRKKEAKARCSERIETAKKEMAKSIESAEEFYRTLIDE